MKNNLKQIRKVKNITQQQLGDYLGVSKAVISMWENNPKENIPQNRIKKICDFLKVDEATLFTEELDIEQLEKSTKEEKLEKLLNDLNEEYVKKIAQLNAYLADELEYMEHEPEKLDKVKRFSKIINNIEIEKLFEQDIHPYGLDMFLEKILTLLEEKNSNKLSKIFVTLEYFELLTSENKLDTVKAEISNNGDFLLKMDKLYNPKNK